MSFLGHAHPDGTLTATIQTPPDMARIHLAGHTINIPPDAVAMTLTVTRADNGDVAIDAQPIYEEPTP